MKKEKRMGKKMKKVVVNVIAASLTLALLLTGCGLQKKGETTGNSDEKVIVVATGNDCLPYCGVNEEGVQTGFNVELWKAMDEVLDGYTFEFSGMAFDNVLVTLEAGQADIADYCFYLTEERAEKYIATDPFMAFTEVVAVREGEEYSSLDDFAGKTISVTSTGNDAIALEEYNSTVDDDKKINLVYSTGELSQRYDDLVNGRIDGYVAGFGDINDSNEAYGGGIKASDVVITSDNCYYLLLPGQEELVQVINGALAQIKESGKYGEISNEWFGYDASPVK